MPTTTWPTATYGAAFTVVARRQVGTSPTTLTSPTRIRRRRRQGCCCSSGPDLPCIVAMRLCRHATITLALACLALPVTAQTVVPAQDGAGANPQAPAVAPEAAPAAAPAPAAPLVP